MQAQAGRVILLTCPTDRVRRTEQQEGRKVIATRNQLLRDRVSSRLGGSAPPQRRGRARLLRPAPPPPLSLVDVDALTQHLPPGLDVAPTDYHYRECGQRLRKQKARMGCRCAEPGPCCCEDGKACPCWSPTRAHGAWLVSPR